MNRSIKKYKKVKFKPEKLVEINDDLINPDRGWYQIHTFKLKEPVSMADREYTLNATDSIAFLLIDISEYRDRQLDDIAIESFRTIFGFFRDYQLDMIVRVVYDTEGRCMETEPSSEDIILTHMSQLVPIIKEFEDVIYVYQGLLIGNWGEMHSSKFLSPTRLRRLSEIFLRELKGNTYLAMRRPAYVRILFPEGNDVRQEQVGIYDDAIMASKTHLGTFGEQAAVDVRRERSWLPHEEINYVTELCNQVPYGGEALWSDAEDGLEDIRNDLSEISQYFRALHLSYLNRIHDQRFIDKLKSLTWVGKDIYKGMNGYDYIGRHLGYRFVIRSVKCKVLDTDKSLLRWDFEIENIGYSKCFFETKCKLLGLDENGNDKEIDISDWMELNTILPGEKRNFVCMSDYVFGPIKLRAYKRKNKQALYFANASTEMRKVDSALLLGVIK